MPIKELHDIELVEVSLLTKNHTPAYDGTLVSVRDHEAKMVLGESMFAEAVEIREDTTETETDEAQTAEATAETETKKEVSSMYYARYKNMIALMGE